MVYVCELMWVGNWICMIDMGMGGGYKWKIWFGWIY